MKTIKVFSLALAVTLMAAIPAGAGARRSRPPMLANCYDQAASLQMPKSQVQAYLPEGFTPSGGAAGQTEVVHVFVEAIVCGDAEPTLEMSKTYVSVDAPAEMRSNTISAEYFVLDMGASGASAARLRKYLCLGSVLEDADIASTQVVPPSSSEPGAGTTTVESPSLSVTFSVAGAGSGLEGTLHNRWFFENEAGQTDYFDSLEAIDHINLGSGEIVFAEQYRDLPLASPALSLYRQLDSTIYRSPGCAGS